MFVETFGLTTLALYTRKHYKRKSLRQQLLQTKQSPTQPTEKRKPSHLIAPKKTAQQEKDLLQASHRRKLRISLVSTGMAAAGGLLYSPLALFSLPGILYITYFPVIDAYNSLTKDRKLTIDVLSGATKILLVVNGYFFLAAVSTTIYSTNRYLLSKVSDNSRKDLIDVFRQAPKNAWIAYNGVEREIPVEALKSGDIIVVTAGNAIPVDGLIVDGSAAVDQQLLTGESQPSEKHKGDDVFALTTVLSGKLYIQVAKAGEETTAAQIASILNSTLNNKTEAQLWSEEMTDQSVLPTLMLSGLCFPVLGPTTALAIMNSHFNYRAIISSTIGLMKYLNVASNNGILVKDGRTFEALGNVDTLVFDKTGTLTEEQPRVGRIHACDGYSAKSIIRLAAAAETRQSHPIAKAIVQKAGDWELELPVVEDADYELGYGLSVLIEDQVVRIGSLRFMEHHNITVPDAIIEMQTQCHNDGSPMVVVAVNNQAAGAIELKASLRQGVKELIQTLHDQGIESTYIISGDHEAPTRKLAQELGMDGYFAETLPEQKAKLIAQLQAQGKTVCYVGDGINDAIALQQADVSVSLSGASSVATDAAEVILMNQTLEKLPFLLNMAQHFEQHIKRTVGVVVAPSLISAGSAIVFVGAGLGLAGSFVLPLVGLAGGLAVAMRPNIAPPQQRSFRSSVREINPLNPN